MSDQAQAAAQQRKKSMLMAAADIQRAHLALATHDIKASVFPGSGTGTGTVAKAALQRPSLFAKGLIAVGVPLLGRYRLGRWLQAASIGLTAVKAISHWSANRR